MHDDERLATDLHLSVSRYCSLTCSPVIEITGLSSCLRATDRTSFVVRCTPSF